MKKVLFATTALVLTAGVAAAEVSLSGDGRMGVTYNGDEFNFASRARVKFTLSGESDAGIAFGGSFRVNDEANGNRASTGGDGSVFISGTYGRLEMGDVVGAPEALFGDFYEVGFTDLDANGILPAGGNDIGYLTGDGNLGIIDDNNPVALYTYSTGPIAVAASFSDGYKGQSNDSDSQEAAIAAAYTYMNYTVGASYEYANMGRNFSTDVVGTVANGDSEASQAGLFGIAAINDVNVKAFYQKGGKDNIIDNYAGIGADYTFGATTVGGYVQYVELADGFAYTDGSTDATSYGIGAEYDLGGGLAVKGGLSDNNLDDTDVVADLGMTFSF